MPLHKSSLDRLAAKGCQMPGCTHDHESTFYFHSRCHPEAPCEVSYTAETGILKVGCYECQRLIAEVKIAED